MADLPEATTSKKPSTQSLVVDTIGQSGINIHTNEQTAPASSSTTVQSNPQTEVVVSGHTGGITTSEATQARCYYVF